MPRALTVDYCEEITDIGKFHLWFWRVYRNREGWPHVVFLSFAFNSEDDMKRLAILALMASGLFVGCNSTDNAAAPATANSAAGAAQNGAAVATNGSGPTVAAYAGQGSRDAKGNVFYRNYAVSVDKYCDVLYNAKASSNKDLAYNIIHKTLGLNMDHIALAMDNANARMQDTKGVNLSGFANYLSMNYGFSDDATLKKLFNLDLKTIELLEREDLPVDDKLFNALKKVNYRLFINQEEIVKPPKGPKFVSGFDANFGVLPPDNVKTVVGITFPDLKSPTQFKRDITLNFVVGADKLLDFNNIASITMQSSYKRAEGEDISKVMQNKGYGGCKITRDAVGEKPDLKHYLLKDHFVLTSMKVNVRGSEAVVYGLNPSEDDLDL